MLKRVQERRVRRCQRPLGTNAFMRELGDKMLLHIGTELWYQRYIVRKRRKWNPFLDIVISLGEFLN